MDKAIEIINEIVDTCIKPLLPEGTYCDVKKAADIIRPYLLRPEWQSCPVCNGQGLVSRPAGIAGDVEQWVSGSAVHPCPLCNGKKIINAITGGPE